MNGADSCMDETGLPAAYAHHLRQRSSAGAEALADRLTDAGQTTRADLLRAFARQGDHMVSADWWEPGATCHVCLGLPEATSWGELWFDPLEVSCTIVLPWLRGPDSSPRLYANLPTFHSWISLEPVAPWQLRGAHDVVADVPPTGDEITGEQADSYCKLFSKGLVGPFEWLWLKEAYGMDVVDRMWGDAGRAAGCLRLDLGGGGAGHLRRNSAVACLRGLRAAGDLRAGGGRATVPDHGLGTARLVVRRPSAASHVEQLRLSTDSGRRPDPRRDAVALPHQ